MGEKDTPELKTNPWLAIWVSPRKTIREIIAFNPRFHFPILSLLYGLPFLFHLAQMWSMGGKLTLPLILIGTVILAPWLGMAAISLITGLLLWTGKLLGGQGNYYTIRAAVSWASVTNIVTLITWALLLFRFGAVVFISAFPSFPFIGTERIYVFSAFIVQFVVSAWSIVILLHALGEVQGFSAWKALLNVLIPLVAVIIVLQVANYMGLY